MENRCGKNGYERISIGHLTNGTPPAHYIDEVRGVK